MNPAIHSCILLLAALCHPAKANTTLLLFNSGLSTVDVRTSLQIKGFREFDPLTKPIMNLPRPAVYSLSIAGDAAFAEVGYRMRRSERWYRHVWWAPQIALAAANGFCIGHNIRQRDYYDKLHLTGKGLR